MNLDRLYIRPLTAFAEEFNRQVDELLKEAGVDTQEVSVLPASKDMSAQLPLLKSSLPAATSDMKSNDIESVINEILNRRFDDVLRDAEWRVKQAYSGNTVPAEGLNLSTHQLTGYILKDNTNAANGVAAGSIAWSNVFVVYQGVSYGPYPSSAYAATTLGYVYWTAGTSNSTGVNTTTSGSHTLPVATVTVASTTGFPTSGQINVGGQVVTYTGVTGTTFTGCTGGTGTIATGSWVGAIGIFTSATQPSQGRDDALLFINTNGIAGVALNPAQMPSGSAIIMGTLTSGNLADGAITSQKVLNNAITSGKLAASAVTSGAISPAAVGSAALSAAAVTSAALSASAVTSAAISPAAVTSGALSASAVTSGAISASAVTSGALSTGAVTSAAIAAAAVTSAALSASAVTSGALSPAAVTSAALSAGAVGSAALSAAAVTSAALSAGAVTSAALANAAVGSAALSANAVTQAAILPGAVTADRMNIFDHMIF